VYLVVQHRPEGAQLRSTETSCAGIGRPIRLEFSTIDTISFTPLPDGADFLQTPFGAENLLDEVA